MTTVGIDFGTTNCSVTTWTGGPDVLDIGLDRPTTWAFEGFEKLMPSVFAAPTGQRLFGWPAKTCPAGNLQAVKRLLAENERMHLHGRTFSCRHVAALLFGALRSGAQQQGVTIDSAVVTVPSDSTGQARFRTRQAAGMAGIKVAALINEPTAAALAYLHAVPDTERVLVFDWGGGTIDVTLLQYERGIYAERASHGVQGLGGLELDRALERVLAEVVRIDEFTPEQRRAFALEIERTKIRLSGVDRDDEVPFQLPDGREVGVTRRAFEREAAHYVLGTLKPLEMCLESTGMQAVDIDAVLLVGGSSLLPYVREQIEERLGVEPVHGDLINPLTAVSEGAALAAAALTGEADVAFRVISNHDLGTRVKEDGVERFSVVIPLGVALPFKTSRRYTPNRDYADILHVQVWEGDAELPLTDPVNVQLADLPLQPDKARVRQENAFDLEYQYDVDGILHISARHAGSGRLLLNDEVDFYSGGPGEIEPELDDISGTFAAQQGGPAPAAQGVKRVRTAYRPHSGPVFVVDGSNLASEGRDLRGGSAPSYRQLTEALDCLRQRYPGAQVFVVVDANLRHKLPDDERAELDQAVKQGRIISTPAGTVGAGDALILDIAEHKNAQVVSNDAYRDFQDRHPWLRHGRLLGAARAGGDWYFNVRQPPVPRQVAAVSSVRVSAGAIRPAPRRALLDSLPVGWDNSHWWSGE